MGAGPRPRTRRLRQTPHVQAQTTPLAHDTMARGSGLGARDSGLGTRGSGLGTRDSGLGEQLVERLADGADAHEFTVLRELTSGWIDVRLGHDAAFESHLRGLAHAQPGLI